MSWRLNCWSPSLSAVLFSVVANPQYHGTVTSSSQASRASCRVSFPPCYSYAEVARIAPTLDFLQVDLLASGASLLWRLFSPIYVWKGKTYRQRVLGARAIIRNCRLSHKRCREKSEKIREKSLSFLRSFSNKTPKIPKARVLNDFCNINIFLIIFTVY